MPYPVSEWRADIRRVLERLSDEAYQRRAWFNRDGEVSSPDELISQLFDDFRFQEFIDSEDVALRQEQKEAARSFSESLLRFCTETPQILSASDIIGDPRWAELRKAAHRVLATLFTER